MQNKLVQLQHCDTFDMLYWNNNLLTKIIFGCEGLDGDSAPLTIHPYFSDYMVL